MDINYTIPAQVLDLTVKNDLQGGSGGNVSTAVYPDPYVSYSSPHSLTAYEGDQLKLASFDNQNVGEKIFFFNDTEYAIRKSEWGKMIGTSSTRVSTSWSFTTALSTTSDDNAQFIAYMRTTSYTTSGTLSSDELIWTPASLTNDLTIANGVTLTIYSSGNLNLNGHSIFLQSTGNVVNHGTISNCICYVKDGSVIKSYHPTLAAGLSNATSGQTVLMKSSQTLSADLTVSSGVTLEISSGTLNLGSKKITSASGDIVITGGSIVPDIRVKTTTDIYGLYPTVQSAINASAWPQRVKLGIGSFSENISMASNKQLDGSGKTATILDGNLTLTSNNGAAVGNMTINGNVDINYGSGNDLYSLRIKNVLDADGGSGHVLDDITTVNSGYFDIYHDDVYIFDISSTNSLSYGVYAYEADPEIEYGEFENKTDAIHCHWYADASVQDIDFCSNNCDIYAGTGCDVSTSGLTRCSGSVITCGPGNVSQPSPGMHTLSKVNPEIAALRNLHRQYRNIWKQVREDRKTDYKATPGKYEQSFRSIIASALPMADAKNSHETIMKALRLVAYCYRALGEHEQVNTIAENLKKNPALKTAALCVQIPWFLESGRYDKALGNADQVIAAGSAEETLPMLYRKAVIWQKYIKDTEKAVEIYSQIINQYPDSPMAWAAQNRLNSLDREILPPQASNKTDTQKFSTANYPNPANPETNIQYCLPEAGRISIKVYNITGQHITTLVDADMPSGQHSVHWSGCDAFSRQSATGVYFYRVTFGNQVKTKKFLLLR
ncbi:T9SS type A sorting domain-containing protein [candidate division KSB1 bacterium]|nr:T9SS type A sorting domain-containing protein [candidate division KSB1 bacterium]